MYYTLNFDKTSMEVLKLTVRNTVVLGLLCVGLYFGYALYTMPRVRESANAWIAEKGAVLGKSVVRSQ